jgi:hypothetical protein
MPYTAKLYIAGTLTIPGNIALIGSNRFPGSASVSSLSANYAALGGAITLGGSGGITMNYGSTISGVLIYPHGMTFPQSGSVTPTWTNTAITVAGDDVTVNECMILGFNKAVYSNGFQRFHGLHVRLDCNNGFDIQNSLDVTYLFDCHAWPYATSQVGENTLSLQRSGVAYSIQNSNDWGVFERCFSYGYQTGFLVGGTFCDSVTLLMCGADNTATGYGTGCSITGGATDITLQSCRFAACVQGILTSHNAGLVVTINDCTVWGNGTHGIFINGPGDVKIVGGEWRNQPNHISLASATPLVDVDEVRFDTSTIVFNVSTATSNLRIGPNNNYGSIAAGGGIIGTIANVGVPTVASASPLLIPPNATDIIVTGTANFGQVGTGWAGREITLYFSGVLQVFSGTGAAANMRLSGNVTYNTTAGGSLTLRHNGTQWYEIGRSA